jgi:hypothetical protein
MSFEWEAKLIVYGIFFVLVATGLYWLLTASSVIEQICSSVFMAGVTAWFQYFRDCAKTEK